MSLFMSTRDQNYFQEKLQSEMERRGVSALLLTQPESVFYATGYSLLDVKLHYPQKEQVCP